VPIYEYACRKCNHTLDALQKMNDAPLVDCPECGEPELRRLLSAPRFRLKGQGWYETDFKKDKQRNLLSADGESSKAKPEKAAGADAGKSEASQPAKESKKETKTVPD
jgi:putative FmdB family regulatory protein